MILAMEILVNYKEWNNQRRQLRSINCFLCGQWSPLQGSKIHKINYTLIRGRWLILFLSFLAFIFIVIILVVIAIAIIFIIIIIIVAFEILNNGGFTFCCNIYHQMLVNNSKCCHQHRDQF